MLRYGTLKPYAERMVNRKGDKDPLRAGGIDRQLTFNSVIWLALRRRCSMASPTSLGAPPISVTSKSNSESSRRFPETMQNTKGRWPGTPPPDGTSIHQQQRARDAVQRLPAD
jgi:hypothetical protein